MTVTKVGTIKKTVSGISCSVDVFAAYDGAVDKVETINLRDDAREGVEVYILSDDKHGHTPSKNFIKWYYWNFDIKSVDTTTGAVTLHANEVTLQYQKVPTGDAVTDDWNTKITQCSIDGYGQGWFPLEIPWGQKASYWPRNLWKGDGQDVTIAVWSGQVGIFHSCTNITFVHVRGTTTYTTTLSNFRVVVQNNTPKPVLDPPTPTVGTLSFNPDSTGTNYYAISTSGGSFGGTTNMPSSGFNYEKGHVVEVEFNRQAPGHKWNTLSQGSGYESSAWAVISATPTNKDLFHVGTDAWSDRAYHGVITSYSQASSKASATVLQPNDINSLSYHLVNYGNNANPSTWAQVKVSQYSNTVTAQTRSYDSSSTPTPTASFVSFGTVNQSTWAVSDHTIEIHASTHWGNGVSSLQAVIQKQSSGGTWSDVTTVSLTQSGSTGIGRAQVKIANGVTTNFRFGIINNYFSPDGRNGKVAQGWSNPISTNISIGAEGHSVFVNGQPQRVYIGGVEEQIFIAGQPTYKAQGVSSSGVDNVPSHL